MIRAEAARRSAGRDGIDDVKLGRGGIRELEFIAQTFQIVRGGRDLGLRSKSTLPTLMMLAKLGVLPFEICGRLAASYVFLRNFEHALQYVDDAQTHRVPADTSALERIARLLGAANAKALITEYRACKHWLPKYRRCFAEPGGDEAEVSLDTRFKAPPTTVR